MPRTRRFADVCCATRIAAEHSAAAIAICQNRPARGRRASALTDIGYIEQAAVFPEPVRPALDTERQQVALVRLAHVPDLLDDRERPPAVEAQHRSEISLDAGEPPD